MIDTQERTESTAVEAPSSESWMRPARAAAIIVATWAAALMALAGLIVPVLVIGLIYLAFIPLLRGERRWAVIAFGVFALVAVAGNAAGVIDELSHPESAPAFLLTLWLVLGTALAVASGVGALLRRPAPPLRGMLIGAVAVFAVGVVVSVISSAAVQQDEALATDVAVVTEGVQFLPDSITVAAGDGLWFDNRDGIRHTFSIEDVYFDVELPALKKVRTDLDLTPGTYEVICRVPGHETMTATLVVEG